MLKINESKTLAASVTIEDQHVIGLNAMIATGEQQSHIGYIVNDDELYSANKEECREKIMAFINRVFEIEDRK